MKHHWKNFRYWLDHGTTRRDMVLCLVCGILSALAMPPVNLFPVLFITFPVLYHLIDKSLTSKQVFFKTWLFHFGFHTAGLYWIAAALFVDLSNNWWAIPFAVMGLPALMSFYPALLIMLWERIGWRGFARPLLFVVMLALSEWVRGWMFTGFPWNLWGYTWTAFLPLLQSVSLFGMYGLTFLTLLLVMLPVFWEKRQEQKTGFVFTILIPVVFVTLGAWGDGRLQQQFPVAENNLTVRVIQPNIAQEAKWNPKTRMEHERKLWGLTIQPAEKTPHVVIWPETALILFSTWDVRRLEDLANEFLSPESVLVTGVLDASLDPKTNAPVYYNRVGMYNSDGVRLNAYDKSHLVPFGEYLPFQEYWPVKPVAFKDGSFSAGKGVTSVTLPNLPAFSPLICYEVLFPGETVDENNRPQWILNVTNDAWYGRTSGPYQHLAIARTRAIEEGLPLVRSANTGISAVIDPLGRITGKLKLGEEGYLDRPLPPSLKPTVFAQYGNSIFFAFLALLGVLAFICQRTQMKTIPHVR